MHDYSDFYEVNASSSIYKTGRGRIPMTAKANVFFVPISEIMEMDLTSQSPDMRKLSMKMSNTKSRKL
jgi:hypothetical protein